MNNRLKAIRLAINLSQEEFGSNIGIKSRAHISSLENGTRNITDRIINDICREYSVSEQWLRTGEGNMFSSAPITCVSELAKEYDLDLMDQNLIAEYLKLDKQSRTVLKTYIKNVFLESEKNEDYISADYIKKLYDEVPKTPEELERLFPPVDFHKGAG